MFAFAYILFHMQNSSRTRTNKPAKRVVVALISAIAATASVLGAPATASAQDFAAGSAELNAQVTDSIAQITSDTREGAWVTRNNIHAQVDPLGPSGLAIKNAVDGAVNSVFPGLIQEKLAAEQAARAAQAEAQAAAQAAAERAAAAARFDRGSCPPAADVCVDLNGGRSWLQENGQVVYGAVPVSSGGIGQETPRGTFYINRKVKDEISYEFGNAPMPYAMYFTYNGHAFHQGNVARTSAGCVRLNPQDAIHYFNNVGIGDMVYIY